MLKKLDKYVKEVNRNIGYKLYEARLMSNLSREDLSRYIGVSKEKLDRYEKGLSRIPEDKLELIAKKLKKPIKYFYANIEDIETILPPIIDRTGKNRGYIRLVRKLSKLTNHNQQRALGIIVDGLL